MPGLPGDSLTTSLNRLAGTIVGGVPRLTAQAAAQQLGGAAAANLDLKGALNVYAGLTAPNWLGTQGVLNKLAKGNASYGLGINEAARLL